MGKRREMRRNRSRRGGLSPPPHLHSPWSTSRNPPHPHTLDDDENDPQVCMRASPHRCPHPKPWPPTLIASNVIDHDIGDAIIAHARLCWGLRHPPPPSPFHLLLYP